jgi:hypothetical protein
MISNEFLDMVSNSQAGRLARSLTDSEIKHRNAEGDPIVLFEINHFFAHHCALPSLISALNQLGNYRYVSYIPLPSWEPDNPTLQVASRFYSCLGIEDTRIKPHPDSGDYHKAKSLAIEQIHHLNGSIWNLSNLTVEGIPLGVHLVETLLQQTRLSEFNQTLETTSFVVGVVARFFWWKRYLSSKNVGCVVASHGCYEFALPLLAAMQIGIPGYVWHDNHLLLGNSFLPLPLANPSWAKSLVVDWAALGSDRKQAFIDQANLELSQRIRGKAVGKLAFDSRMDPKDTNPAEHHFSLENEGKPKIVVYCHAFSDAPCTLPSADYGNLCSPLVSTRRLLEILSPDRYAVFLKTHPAPFPQDEEAVRQLLETFPQVRRLPGSLSVNDQKEMGIQLIVSGWGSVVFEALFADVPVLCYTPFHFLSDHAPSLYVSLEDPEAWDARIVESLNGANAILDRKLIVEAYAISTVGTNVELTCSEVPRLPREGSEGRYSPYALRVWAETFDAPRFSRLVSALLKFFHQKGDALSVFRIE